MNDIFGYYVSISSDDNTVDIGGTSNYGYGSNSEYNIIYAYIHYSWVKVGDDIVGESIGDNSVSYVTISSYGETVSVGASDHDNFFLNPGNTRVSFDPNPNRLSTSEDLTEEPTLVPSSSATVRTSP